MTYATLQMALTSTDPDVEISDSAAVQYKIQRRGFLCMEKQTNPKQTFHVHVWQIVSENVSASHQHLQTSVTVSWTEQCPS